MKRYKLIKHLEKNGCLFLREGKKHTVYYNPANNKTSTVPRYKEIANKLARKICNDIGIELI